MEWVLSSDRAEIKKALESRDIDVVIADAVWKEGVDHTQPRSHCECLRGQVGDPHPTISR